MTDLDDALSKFEEHYRYLESSFLDITRIIPLENKPETFSPRLYEILQSICSQVDGIVRLMHKKYISTSKEPTAALYEALNQKGIISYQVLVHKSRPNWKPIKPFLCNFECALRDEDDDLHEYGPHERMPKWWKAYNDSKHDLPEGYRAGNIENTYLALAGLYLLHVMMRQNLHDKEDFLKKDSWVRYKKMVISGGKGYSYERIIAGPSSDLFVPGLSLMQGEFETRRLH